MEDSKKWHSFTLKDNSFICDQLRSFWGASIKAKLCGISVLNAKGTLFKKINVLFIVNFSLGKYSFSLNTFFEHTLYIYTKWADKNLRESLSSFCCTQIHQLVFILEEHIA